MPANIDYTDKTSVQQEVIKYRNAARDYRQKKLDPDWFVWQSFVRGNHWVKWDVGTGQIARSGGNELRVTVNKVFQTLRSVRNYVLRNDPKWSVVGINRSEESRKSTEAAGKFLDYIFRVESLRRKFKEVVNSALIHSVGLVQVMWDGKMRRGEYEGDINIEVIDPFDFYVDPNATSIQDARYVFKAVKRNIEDLQNNEVYDQKAVERLIPDKDMAASPYKERLMQQHYGSLEDAGDDSVIVYECWIKNYTDEGNQIYIVTVAGDGDEVIRNEETEMDRFPFFAYQADINTLEMYGEGWVKNLIPLNKVYNAVMSMIVEHIATFKGKVLAPKGAGIKRITNATGEIIKYKIGKKPEIISPPSLPNAPFNLLELINVAFEDIGAVHDATLGRIPSGAKSGKALEALQAGDANNLSDLIQNFEDFASQVGQEILRIAAEKYTEARIIDIIAPDGQPEQMAVIGEEADNKPDRLTNLDLDVFQIGKVNEVVVTLSSWLAHTEEARIERLMELYDRQIVSVEEVRKELKMSPTPEGQIIAAMPEEEVAVQEDGQLAQLEEQLGQVQSPEELAQLEQQAAALGV